MLYMCNGGGVGGWLAVQVEVSKMATSCLLLSLFFDLRGNYVAMFLVRNCNERTKRRFC